jgi:hypothetical protein
MELVRFAETLLPLLHEDEKKAVELAQAEVSNSMTCFIVTGLMG